MFFLPIMIVLTKVLLCLHNKGIKVEAVIDIRENSDSNIVKAVKDAGITIHWSHTIVDTKGYKRLNSISVMKLSNDGFISHR